MKRFLPRRRVVDGDQHNSPTHSPRKTFPSGIKLLYSPENNDACVDIVFVHGLTGDRDRTWTDQNATEPWPKLLLPSVIPTTRVLTFGYDAENDDTNERPLIFVCHSLGGLVCEDALVMSKQRPEQHLQNILRSTRGIAFLGTPHHGSGLARWAELMSKSIDLVKRTNSHILEVLKRDSEVLARIQNGFHTLVKARISEGLPPIEITCFYEELPLVGVGLVVPQDSAILPGYPTIGIHSNHRDMTKFSSEDDPGFVAICGELRRWVKGADGAGKRVLPPSPQGASFDKQPATAKIFGDGNRQYNSFGGTQTIVGGHTFESKGDQYFGVIPPKEPTSGRTQ
ncbi:uncharacterized protein DNG_04474 [Cephalotrichum gorgonifer]|uniref:DUF676 domain-containing protein n=1 Tax=Cephalotrichum gorgonifer TaxID=2041049 RepID=A0AAE8SUL2_9PEZI|nr:uncharacterized protein DNG_04474 [Cephalotrichum gorgonifer]